MHYPKPGFVNGLENFGDSLCPYESDRFQTTKNANLQLKFLWDSEENSLTWGLEPQTWPTRSARSKQLSYGSTLESSLLTSIA